MAARERYLDFVLPDAMSRVVVSGIVERAVRRAGLRVSYVGGYGADPESVHWHIAAGRERRPAVEATYWHEQRAFWLMRPASSTKGSFRDVAKLQRALRSEFSNAHHTTDVTPTETSP